MLMDDVIQQALREDCPWADVTSEALVSPELRMQAALVARQPGVISGLDVMSRAFQLCDPELDITVAVAPGRRVSGDELLLSVSGSARSILRAERIALNFGQRLCGVATLTRQYVDAVASTSSRAQVVDTRKTTPGLRIMEKRAVVDGGGINHRFGLSDAILVKDNHLAAIGGVAQLKNLKQSLPHVVHVEVEIDSVDDLEHVLEVGVDSVLCDNFTLDDLRKAVKIADGRALIEASGGVNLDTVAAIAQTGVDLISVGALTHSAPALDLALDTVVQ
jgi:nicotinate-nucleotide pyrophosphorylase (carboxylating)